jgi:hypothetical protein
MPIAIVIAIFLALFTLGTKMHMSSNRPSEVMILGGKQYNWVDKKNNGDTLVLKAPEQTGHKIIIKGRRYSESFENIFRQIGFSRFIDEAEEEKEMKTTNYITRNIQAAYVPVK